MQQARKTILFIEDDHETSTLITEELAERGFDVHVAFTGVDGFSAILTLQPDLVLSDICMHGGSGLDVLKWLAATTSGFRRVRFLFLTAMTDSDVEVEARRLGADGFVTKPVDFDLLAAAISACLGGNARSESLPKCRCEPLRGGGVDLDIISTRDSSRIVRIDH
jgi:DNA-binding response OmpR family regulator